MAKFKMTIQSRSMYCGPEKNSVGELWDAICYCKYSDGAESNKDFDITLYSDAVRFNSAVAYDTAETVVNNQPAAGQPQFRNNIQIIPQEGFYGSFFGYKIEKMVPLNGSFDWDGVDMHAIPRPEIDAEFLAGCGTINNGWV